MNTKQVEKFQVGDLVESEVIKSANGSVYLDMSPFGTGIIYGREFLSVRDVLKNVKVGDKITAQIIDLETPDGYIDLSLKEARKAEILSNIEDSIKSETIFEISIKGANRGGLTTDWNHLRGFLPASQLLTRNYPKPTSNDKNAVADELKKFIGKKFKVKISNFDATTNNVIFSEVELLGDKGDSEVQAEKTPEVTLQIGEEHNGTVIGIVDFGIFLKLHNNIQGLVHISEIDWGLVDNPHKFYKLGDIVRVKVMDIEDSKYFFSVKALKENPWNKVANKYKEGDIASGVVIKYHKHGAFASIEAGVTGLIHVSNFKNEEDLRDKLEIGKTYKFKITVLNPKEQKLTLVTT